MEKEKKGEEEAKEPEGVSSDGSGEEEITRGRRSRGRAGRADRADRALSQTPRGSGPSGGGLKSKMFKKKQAATKEEKQKQTKEEKAEKKADRQTDRQTDR